jgi:hypothetical protein
MTPTDHNPGGASRLNVPELINEYRALQEAFRAHAQQLARVREQVRVAADREASAIVAAVRRDMRQLLVEARNDLRALAVEVQTSIDAHQQIAAEGGPAEPLGAGSDDLRMARETIASARQKTREVLDSVRPDLAELEEELRAFSARLRRDAPAAPRATPPPVPPPAPAPVPVARDTRPSPLEAAYQTSPVFPSESSS